MSWSSSYPPPPRRSRSRSPRGSYPPRSAFPDSTYMGDTYRSSDWDNYDRERWSSYDRDRGLYEYGRRRSRSPPSDESRKRRRSVSPYERDRDRYDPRPRYSDDYDTHSRGYGYASPPRRGPPGAYPSSRRAPPDPHTFEFPATLKQYAEWFRFFYPQQAIEEDNADKAAEQEAGDGSKPRNGIRSKWEKYKKEFAANQLQTMFDHHRKSPWFAEKYDPEFKNLRLRVRKEGWRGRINTFLDDLESGKFDPDLNESEPEPPSPSAKDSSVVNENTTEINGSVAEDSKPSGGDDEMQFTVEADEEAAELDTNRPEANGRHLSDNKRNNRGEELSVLPEGNQVMIRTIPPDIGRVKLEETCTRIPGFVHLALGDPLQKRNFYRAGWIRFQDDADMMVAVNDLSDKKIEGFKLHVSHVVKPFTNRIRYTPDVASRPERLEKDLANAKVLVAQLEEEAAKLRTLKVSELKLKSKTNNEAKPEEDTSMAPAEEQEEEPEMEPREKGCEAVERRAEKIMVDLREQGLVDPSNEKEYEEKKIVVTLDLYLAYLRAAYNTCYYCAVITDHLEELQRKCIKHERKAIVPTPAEYKPETENNEKKVNEIDGTETEKDSKERDGKEKKDDKRNDGRWLEWLDSKIALLINRDGVDPREYGGKFYEEELSKAAEPHIKQEDEGKFRCKTCQKLFRATPFVEKHIANKHPELVKHLEDLPYFNSFVLDPHRIQPFTHPPSTIGNTTQAPPPQAYGIQGPAFHGEYPRIPGHYPYPPGAYPPSYAGGYQWDPYSYPYGAPSSYPPPPVLRRDEGANAGRRLSDRISGFVSETTVPAGAGLPPKPPAAALDSALSSGNGNGNARRGARSHGSQVGGPPPPPPPDAKEDPRAAAGKRVSYHDMDLVAEGDVELFY
ncbi:hypothetical protein Agabi119p4_4830 [Agaricus bisporus var. burnettii]|uniref:C2H2-type domain-containing protein n=1 Tax=Agaricus bisporus var. burnettii TaxID=192524 RepID=A0A8H7F404_AGABI|nr:hypothetical protein Agabi119p4_4830 [Agaricus bisporus var. burnettii]